jgi:hypothetical protein
MIAEEEVRDKLAALASHELSVEEFAEWLEPASWNMHADSSPEAIDLVSSIHLLLSEYDHGDIDDPQLRKELSSLLDDVVIAVTIDTAASIVRRAPASKFGATGPRISWEVRVPA